MKHRCCTGATRMIRQDRAFLAREQGPEVIALQRRLKRAFDPDDLLNPGKILPL